MVHTWAGIPEPSGYPLGQALTRGWVPGRGRSQAEGGMLGFIRKKFVGSYLAFNASRRRSVSGW